MASKRPRSTWSSRTLVLPILLLSGIIGLTTLYRLILGGKPIASPLYNGSISAARPVGQVPPTSNETLPRIHLFMPIDRVSKADYKMGYRFCRVVQCAIVNGWEPNVFNWEAIEDHTWSKPFGLKAILDSPSLTADIALDDLILMIDSLDVFLQLPPSTMARRFLEYGEDILVGAEKNCWPNSQAVCDRAPRSPIPEELYHKEGSVYHLKLAEKPPAHANSGTVIGTLSKMRAFYAMLTEYMESDRYRWKGLDDQGAFNDFVVEGKVKLDYYSRLFWLAYEDADNIRFQNTRYHPDSIQELNHRGEEIIPWNLYPPLGHHLPTGEVPASLHCNGPIKDVMDGWWGKSWWNSKSERFRPLIYSRMDKATIRFVDEAGYREESVREVCPMLDVWE